MDAVMQARIRAFDEFTSVFKKYESELKNVDQAQRGVSQSARDASTQTNDFLQTVTQVGGLIVFKQGLMDVISVGREYEQTIKQAQAVTGDYSETLRNLSMAMQSNKGGMDLYGPTELARAYRELGQMGADTNDIIASTPAVLQFATASMLGLEDASYGVLATAKSFNYDFTQLTQITDAYTEAMNRGALAGQDFRWIMSSAGAVAKMTGQDFREILSAGSAMRDAGMQAQDGGTSIKAALLALMNPSKEAAGVMKDLNLNVYDASGKMKQWHEIVAAFEQALGPYNQQSRDMIMTTILGSDGIRAMATSLNKGSGYLKTFTEDLKSADGATNKMAQTMSESFDGAVRRVNANLERSKVLMFEDFEGGATGFLTVLNDIIIGFNNLDRTGRTIIELLVGGTGLTVAIATVTSTMRMLGITLTSTTGMIGILIASLSFLIGTILAVDGAATQQQQAQAQIIATNYEQIGTIEKLEKRYQELAGTANRTADQEDELKSVTQQLTDLVPEAVNGYDAMGNAMTDMGTAAEGARIKVAQLTEEAKRAAEIQAQIAQGRMAGLQEKMVSATLKRDTISQYLSEGSYQSVIGFGTNWQSLKSKFQSDDDIRETAYNLLASAQTEWEEANKQLQQAQSAITTWNEIKAGGRPTGTNPTGGGGGKPAGNRNYTPPQKDEESKKAQEATNRLIEAATNALRPYKAATEQAANAVSVLGIREQILTTAMQNGNGGVYDAINLNRIRTQQLVELNAQQDALHKENVAQSAQLQVLEKAYKAAHDPKVAKALIDQISNINKSIQQNGLAWWQVEQQKQTLLQAEKQEEKKRWEDSYQKATSLMRHQVAMAGMSVDQQIQYLIKLKDAYKWTDDQIWSMDEELFRLRRSQLSDYMDDLRDEYQDQLDQLDADTKAKVDALQSQIDALDKKSQGNSRADALKKHNDKLKELQDKFNYESVRTGSEHEKAKADILKQIQEENYAWEQQQQEWNIEDQKANLQDQITAVEDAKEEERKKLEDHYKQVIDLADQNALDTLAALAAKNPEFLETGKNWIKSLMDGINLENPAFQELISTATGQITGYQNENQGSSTTTPSTSSGGSSNNLIWTIGPGQYTMVGDKATLWARELGTMLGADVGWDGKQVSLGGRQFTPLKLTDGKAYLGIREVLEAFGYTVGWDNSSKNIPIYKAAQGMFFTGEAYTKIAEEEPEVAMPLSKFQPMMDEAVAKAQAKQDNSPALERMADRIVNAINDRLKIQIDKLLNIEHYETSEEYDVDMLGAVLYKQVSIATEANG